MQRKLPPNMIFQQHGAPTHYTRAVRDLLDADMPNYWIGSGGLAIWPARSWDLTASDFPCSDM